METKDFIIYNGIIDAARRVFGNVKCPAGEYSAKELSKNLLLKYFWDENFWNSNEFDEIIKIEFDGFCCSFPANSVFNICADIETAWGIPSARRAKFVRAADSAAPVVSFDVPSFSKTIINAVCPERIPAAESCKYICIDTRRRAIVSTNGKVLTAAAVPDMFVNSAPEMKHDLHPGAGGRFCVDPILLKSGKGTLIIDENGNAANGTQIKEIFSFYPFPAWEKVLPAVSDSAAVVLGKQFAALKKAILAAAKYSNTENSVVILRAVNNLQRPEIEIIGYKENNENENAPAVQEKAQKIELSAPVPPFIIAINGKDINAVATAQKMYVISENSPVIFTDEKYFALLMPVQLDKTPYKNNSFSTETGTLEILDICKFPALDSENSPAAVPAAAAADNAPAVDQWANSLPRAAVYFGEINVFAADSAARLQQITNKETAPAVQDQETAPAVQEIALETPENVPAFNIVLCLPAPVADSAPAVDQETETAPAVQETAPASFISPFACLPEIWETAPAAQKTAPAAPENVPAVSLPAADSLAADSAPETAETAPADSVPADPENVAAVLIAANFARRFRTAFNICAAFFCLLLLSAAPQIIKRVNSSAPAEFMTTAPAVPADSCKQFAPVQGCPEIAPINAPETAPAVDADSLPADREKAPRNARKRARRAASAYSAPVADSLAVSLPADSLGTAPADSLAAVADSVPALILCPDSVPVADSLAVSLPADSLGTAPAAQKTAAAPAAADSAPAVDAPETETETAAPAVQDQQTETAPADSTGAPDSPETPVNSAPVPAVSVPAVSAPAPAVLSPILIYLLSL